VSIKFLILIFCGVLFDQAIGIGSNRDAPKTTRSSSSTSSKFLFASSFAQPHGKNNRIYLDIYNPYKVMLPTSQESSQSEVPTSGYGRITDGCTS
jgi:hypothetical protein